MFVNAINFKSEQFKTGTLLVKGHVLIDGEEPPLTEIIHQVFTIDYQRRHLKALSLLGSSAFEKRTTFPEFSLDNLVIKIQEGFHGLESVVDALTYWGTVTDLDWWADTDDTTIMLLAKAEYPDLGVVFFYYTAENARLGKIKYLEYQELE